jgi:hypothetical protein
VAGDYDGFKNCELFYANNFKIRSYFPAIDNLPSMELDLYDINERISFIRTIRNRGRGDYLIGNQVDNDNTYEDEKGLFYFILNICV